MVATVPISPGLGRGKKQMSTGEVGGGRQDDFYTGHFQWATLGCARFYPFRPLQQAHQKTEINMKGLLMSLHTHIK